MKYILSINSGSTSLKFKLFDLNLNQIRYGVIEKIGQDNSIINLDNDIVRKKVLSHKEALEIVHEFLLFDGKNDLDFVVHRIVHGAQEFSEPVILSNSVLSKISKYNELAPLHNPINILVAKNAISIWKKIKHIGVFDTMFFKDIPDYAYTYPLSKVYLNKYKNIRKFGFHGFSHQGMLQEVSKRLNKNINECNIITCHLGGGSSVAIIKNGKAIDVSMGFSPVSGLMMMTRSGDIDSSIINYLISKKEKIEDVFKSLNFDSGIKGVSEINDLRDVMILCGYKIDGYKSNIKKTSENKKHAKLALSMFVYRIQRFISSYMTLLSMDYKFVIFII